ncbi:hypothetical protein [Reinekea blandensis]|uniref:Lipoprotein n=1 Tax=Reinekea blandensis MED297 TaxID=314283 RepID=A4BCT2_9GAMM|nr:hypothetical protein [Reinekea blandensis]EAR10014.1 hypothetical protein MED297_07996 [Reinekea sp. MED297] [Reinekea blandensis MED297]
MLKPLIASAAIATLASCASLQSEPSTAQNLASPSPLTFKRDLRLIEAREVMRIADLDVDLRDDAWIAEWQGYEFDAETLTPEEAQRIKDALYDFPLRRVDLAGNSEAAEFKDSLGDTFGVSIRLMMTADANTEETELVEQYANAAQTFYDTLNSQAELTVSSRDVDTVTGTDVERAVKLEENFLNMNQYNKGEQVSSVVVDDKRYVSGFYFVPKMSMMDAFMAKPRKSYERQVDAAVMAFLALDIPNLYLVIGQNAQNYLPPGVVDNDGQFHIAYRYRDGGSLTLPAELVLYQTKLVVDDLLD